MAINKDPGCRICGKERFTATQLCKKCNDKADKQPQKKEQEEPRVLNFIRGQANVQDCNICRPAIKCEGKGLRPTGNCRHYRPVTDQTTRFMFGECVSSVNGELLK